MLRAGRFALAALDAVGSFALPLRHNDILSLGSEFRGTLLAVFHREDLRDRDGHRTALGAVVAGRTRNGLVFIQCFLCLSDHLHLFFT